MKKTKRLISLLITLCLMLCCSVTSLTASAEMVNNPEAGIDPQYLYTNTVSTSLSKSGSNSIYYYGKATGTSSATKISIYVYLQRYENGTWGNIDTVNKSVSGKTLTASDTFSSAAKGGKYRTEAHIYVYSGSKYEYIEVFSGTMIFN